MPHRWTEEDDIIALYVYKYGHRQLRCDTIRISELLGMSPDSFKMRVANFKAIDAGSGLANAALQTERIYFEYLKTPEPDLRTKGLAILEEAKRQERERPS